MMMVAAVLGLTATSCRKDTTHDAYLESSGTRVKEVTVKYDDWVTNDEGVNYIYFPINWDILTDHVVYDGNVNVYVYENGRQNPLPYVYPLGYVTYSDSSSDFAIENLRYDVEVGCVTLIMQDMDLEKPVVTRNWPDMTFRIVATAPINYVIQQ